MHVSFSNGTWDQFLGQYWGRFLSQNILCNCHPVLVEVGVGGERRERAGALPLLPRLLLTLPDEVRDGARVEDVLPVERPDGRPRVAPARQPGRRLQVQRVV